MQTKSVRITELDFSKRRAPSGIMDNVFDCSSNVAMSLSIVICSELRGCLVEASVGRCIELSVSQCWLTCRRRTEDGSTALPLIADDSTHSDHC